MPLLIVVGALIVIGVVWRARVNRRLTIEASVDRYRRSLSAVHEAATRSRAGETPMPGGAAPPPAPAPAPRVGTRFAPPVRSHAPVPLRTIVVAVVAIAIVATAIVVATTRGGKDHPRAAAPSTTHPPATHPSTTTTTVAAPTTTLPLLRSTDPSGTSFVVGKPSYTLVLAASNLPCWVEARDAAGASLFTGLLAAGASQSITASHADINLGNPGSVTVTLDGTPVPFTTHNGAPLTLHFQSG